MDDVKRWVNLAFVFGAMILGWFWSNTTSVILGLFDQRDFHILGEYVTLSVVIGIVLAIITTIVLYKNKTIYKKSIEVADEMKRVTWPTWDETKHAMKVVIITSIIVALILCIFDFCAEHLTALILKIG